MAVVPEHRDVSHSVRGTASIAVDVDPARVGDYSALVALGGEHDIATSEAMRVALAPLCGRILVDLTDCHFIDSTIISILLKKGAELRREGHELELRVTGESIVARAFTIIGVERFIAVRERS